MKRLILGLTAFLITPGVASAQDGWGWSIIIPSVAQTDILGTHLRDLRVQDEARGRRVVSPRVAAPAAPSASTDPAALRYAPSKTRRSANLAAFVAKSRQSDPAGAKSLEELFSQGDIIERFGQAMAPHGLRIDNVGDAYAVWWISAWQATKGSTETPGDRTIRAVQAQARRALVGTPELAGAGDGAKQQLVEALLIQSMLLEAAVTQAKGDPAQLRAVASAAAQGARGMGLDLAAMQLTDNGFLPAGRH